MSWCSPVSAFVQVNQTTTRSYHASSDISPMNRELRLGHLPPISSYSTPNRVNMWLSNSSYSLSKHGFPVHPDFNSVERGNSFRSDSPEIGPHKHLLIFVGTKQNRLEQIRKQRQGETSLQWGEQKTMASCLVTL